MARKKKSVVLSYAPNTWEDGDVITKEKLNSLEESLNAAHIKVFADIEKIDFVTAQQKATVYMKDGTSYEIETVGA